MKLDSIAAPFGYNGASVAQLSSEKKKFEGGDCVYTRSSSSAMARPYWLAGKLYVRGESATDDTLLLAWYQPTKLTSPSVWIGTGNVTLPEPVVTLIWLRFEFD